MSQYNWNLWFVLNIIGFTIGFLIGMCGDTTTANIVMLIVLASFIPCLYIGMKPIEH